jgi:hypothetical protein
VIDSTRLKIYGEGEWKTHQHGVSKRRTWRKMHLGFEEATGEIVAVVTTSLEAGGELPSTEFGRNDDVPSENDLR